MPSLVALQKAFGREEFLVLALSSDRGGARVVEPFLKEHGLEGLAVYLDPRGNATRKLGVKGLPTSILLDGEGRGGDVQGPGLAPAAQPADQWRGALRRPRRHQQPEQRPRHAVRRATTGVKASSWSFERLM